MHYTPIQTLLTSRSSTKIKLSFLANNGNVRVMICIKINDVSSHRKPACTVTFAVYIKVWSEMPRVSYKRFNCVYKLSVRFGFRNLLLMTTRCPC